MSRLAHALVPLLLLSPQIALAAPRISFTDIVTGPNTGGENGHGAYLTLRGSGFGDSQGSSQVAINGVPVAAYKRWSDTRITVQPGAGVTSGPIRVTVNGETSPSDANVRFTVVPGDIYFVALDGDDATGEIGNVARPFRHIQDVLDRADFGPGDQLVARGGDWTDVYSQYNSLFSIHHKSGTPTAPLVVMGYPTETVNLLRTAAAYRGIHTWETDGHFVIANFHINLNGSGSSCISPGVGTVDVRIVNNEGQGMMENSGGSACIDGSGKQFRIFGNHIHDNGGSKLYHAIYMDARDTSGPDDIEIAYNDIHHQTGGRGVQIYGDTGTHINNVRVHHNLIHDIALDGIVFSQDSGTGCQAYNNVIYRTAVAELRGPFADIGTNGGCIRFVSNYLVADVYNNTLAECAVDNDLESGAFRFQGAVSVTLRNNIVTGKYFVNMGSMPQTLASSNNLWFGAGGPPSWDTGAISVDPLFADAAHRNYHLTSTSPAIGAGVSTVNGIVSDDFDGNPRAPAYDVGAYQFVRGCTQPADCHAPPACHTALGATCNGGTCVYPIDNASCSNDAGATTDASAFDAGPRDAGALDAGRTDGGPSSREGCCDGGSSNSSGGSSATSARPGSQASGDAGCACSTRVTRTSSQTGALATIALGLSALTRRRLSRAHARENERVRPGTASR